MQESPASGAWVSSGHVAWLQPAQEGNKVQPGYWAWLAIDQSFSDLQHKCDLADQMLELWRTANDALHEVLTMQRHHYQDRTYSQDDATQHLETLRGIADTVQNHAYQMRDRIQRDLNDTQSS